MKDHDGKSFEKIVVSADGRQVVSYGVLSTDKILESGGNIYVLEIEKQ